MDNPQKRAVTTIIGFYNNGHRPNAVHGSSYLGDNDTCLIDNLIITSKRNERLFEEALEYVRKIIKTPLYKVLNS